jgi:hypothetical protein
MDWEGEEVTQTKSTAAQAALDRATRHYLYLYALAQDVAEELNQADQSVKNARARLKVERKNSAPEPQVN